MHTVEVNVTTLSGLRQAVNRLASRIGAQSHLFPTYGDPRGDATPCLQLDDRGFHYVISERGQEYERVTSRDPTEILYLVFKSITFSMAAAYEVAHRIEGRDSRRPLFQHQTELLSQLSDNWAERLRCHHEGILKTYPFDDNAHARVDLYVSLRAQRMSEDAADREAYSRYPPPPGGVWPEQLPKKPRS